MSKPKRTILIIIVVIIIGGVVLLFQRNTIFKIVNGQDVKIGFLDDPSTGLSSMPEGIRNFCTDEEHKKIKYGYHSTKEFKNHKDKEKIINLEKEYKPENYDEYKTELCNYVLERVKEPKKLEILTIPEMQKLPACPRLRIYLNSIRLWAHISNLLDCEGKDTESLLVAYAGIYVVRDLETQYQTSKSMMNRMIGCALRETVAQEILRWASKPRPKSAQESKLLAKDILELLKTDAPISVNYEIEQAYIKALLDYCAKRGNLWALATKLSGYHKEQSDYHYGYFKKYDGKPYYEYKNDIINFAKKFNDESEKHYHNSKGIAFLSRLLLSPIHQYSDDILFTTYPNCKSVIGSVESRKAKMEMCVIALAYNAYQAEKGRTPASMQELKEWFGEDLPCHDNLNNKPYKINEHQGFVLYNDGTDGKHEGITKSKLDHYTDDFAFEFIIK